MKNILLKLFYIILYTGIVGFITTNPGLPINKDNFSHILSYEVD